MFSLGKIPGLIGLSVLLIAAVHPAQAATVSGLVQDQDGSPVEGATVTFIEESSGQEISTYTGSDGTYEAMLALSPTAVSMHQGEAAAQEFALFQSYPNPFNPETVIPYNLPRAAHVSLTIYSSMGQKIRTLVNGSQPAGFYQVTWDATDDAGSGVAAGVYFYRLNAADFVQTGKMLLVDGRGTSPQPAGKPASMSESSTAGKLSALPSLFTVAVSGEGFLPYRRTGLAIDTDMSLDVVLNSDAERGMLRLWLTDAPADEAEAMNVTISEVQIRRAKTGPWESFPLDDEPTYNLLDLTDGRLELLGEQALEPGLVTGVRLIVESADIVFDGTSYDLFIPSGSQTGLKLQGNFEIGAGGQLDLVLDFDARRSVVQRGHDMDFLLQPVIRLVSAAETGSISGRIIRGGQVSEDVPLAVTIKAFQEGDEISSAKADPEDGTYRLSYLPAGRYDVVPVKDEDLIDENVIIKPEQRQGILVLADKERKHVDFTLLEAPDGVTPSANFLPPAAQGNKGRRGQ